MALSDYQALTTDLTRDDLGKVTTTQRDTAIASAVRRYGDDRPRTRVDDVTASGANKAPLPAGWQAGFSRLATIEWPVGNVPPDYLDADRCSIYRDASQADSIMLLDAVGVGATLRVSYTIRHLVDVSNDTVPEEDREAVCCWAAALLCDQLAAFYSGQGDSTIQADAVDHGGRAREYAQRASSLRKRYLSALGLDERKNVAHGVMVNLDLPASDGGDRLTHPSWRR